MAEPFLQAGPAVAAGLPVTVTVRYFAAARAAAGLPEELITVRQPEDPSDADGGGASSRATTVAMVLAEASERHGAGLHRVLLRCSYLLDETAVHGTDTVVRHGQALDVLPPFAGGADREPDRGPSAGRPPPSAVRSALPRRNWPVVTVSRRDL